MFFKIINNNIFINIAVKPNKKETKILSIEKFLIISLNSPPVEGKANQELIYFISKKLSVPKSEIELVQGEKSKNKLLKLALSAELIKKLEEWTE